MQNKKIIIFGDSYGDPDNGVVENDTRSSWIEMLSKTYSLESYAKAGSGSHYAINQFYDLLSLDIHLSSTSEPTHIPHFRNLRDTCLIFFLSGQDRINFQGTSPYKGNDIKWNKVEKKSEFLYKKDHSEHGKKEYDKIKFYYETFKDEIDFLYTTWEEEIENLNIKNLGFLYMISQILNELSPHFNFKIIIFFTIESSINDHLKQLLKSDQFCVMNNNNFFIYPTLLSEISHLEFINKNKVSFTVENLSDLAVEFIRREPFKEAFKGEGWLVDRRRNHLTQKNHKIFYNNLIKIFENDYENLQSFEIGLLSTSGDNNPTYSEEKIHGKFIYE